MQERILELFKELKEFTVEFETYEEACKLLKFIEENTDIVWRSGDKPTEFYSYFKRNDYYLVVGSRLARRKKYEGLGYCLWRRVWSRNFVTSLS